jgi:Flp pilus assembly protein TadD
MRAIQIFYCYAHEDKEFLNDLERHLEALRRSGKIITWFDRDIHPGSDWAQEIDLHLNTADIVLLFVSADFIFSNYCWGVEMKRALEMHKADEAHVIPIILRPVDWKETPIGELQALPTEGRPVTKWRSRDEAFLDVSKEIRRLVEALSPQTQQAKEQWVDKGNKLYHANRYEKAMEAYDQAIRLDPNDGVVYCYQGYALLHLKRYEAALVACDQVLRLDPNDLIACYHRGHALLHLKRYDEALAAYEQTIQLDPGFAAAYYNKGQALRWLAQQAYKKARELGFAEYSAAEKGAGVRTRRVDSF